MLFGGGGYSRVGVGLGVQVSRVHTPHQIPRQPLSSSPISTVEMSTILYIPTVSPVSPPSISSLSIDAQTDITLVAQEDLASFDQAHFSEAHHAHLSSQFLPPPPPAEVVIPDDDGLGYYPDGRKRTLTDEQIAIFRHSEIQELLRTYPLTTTPPPPHLTSIRP